MPPFTGVAVKVTLSPSQMGFAEGVIETLQGRLLLTIIVIVLEVAGFPLAQVMLELNMQMITSPLAGV